GGADAPPRGRAQDAGRDPAGGKKGPEQQQPDRDEPGGGQHVPVAIESGRSGLEGAVHEAPEPRAEEPVEEHRGEHREDERDAARRRVAGLDEPAAHRTQAQAPAVRGGGERREAAERGEVHGEDVAPRLPDRGAEADHARPVERGPRERQPRDVARYRRAEVRQLAPSEREEQKRGGPEAERLGIRDAAREAPSTPGAADERVRAVAERTPRGEGRPAGHAG